MKVLMGWEAPFRPGDPMPGSVTDVGRIIYYRSLAEA